MLSDNIRKFRKENNMSQDELAERLDVSRQSVSLWENGQTQPTVDNIIALSKIFNISADELLGGEIEAALTASPDNSPEEAATGKPKRKRKLWLWILIPVLVIAIAGGVYYFFGEDIAAAVSSSVSAGKTSASSEKTSGKSKKSSSSEKESKKGSTSAEKTDAPSGSTAPKFDLFEYCKNFAIQNGEPNGDYTIYQKSAGLYGGYSNEYFSISYWTSYDKVEFSLHCPLDDTYSINFYLIMRGGYNGKYEYSTSRYYRSTGTSLRSAYGYIDPASFSENHPLPCDTYEGPTSYQNDFMEESRVGMCDLIKCLKKFVEVEGMQCGFGAFGFVNF